MVTLAGVFRGSGYKNRTAIIVCRATIYPQEPLTLFNRIKAVDQLFSLFHFAAGRLRKAQTCCGAFSFILARVEKHAFSSNTQANLLSSFSINDHGTFAERNLKYIKCLR